MDETDHKCWFLGLAFFSPLANDKLLQQFEAFEGKKALGAVTPFKTPFICRASSVGALYRVQQMQPPVRHAHRYLTEQGSRTQKSKVKPGKDKLCSYSHDCYLLGKYVHLFLKWLLKITKETKTVAASEEWAPESMHQDTIVSTKLSNTKSEKWLTQLTC